MDAKKLLSNLLIFKISLLSNKLQRECSELHELSMQKEYLLHRKTTLERRFNKIQREKIELQNLNIKLTQVERKRNKCLERKRVIEKDIKLEKKLFCAQKILDLKLFV